MLKWVGIILIIGTTSILGIDMSNKYSHRVREIRQFILSLQMIEAEIVYSQLTLKNIFMKLSEQLDDPVKQFYEQLTLKMNAVVIHFIQLWEEQLATYYKTSSLKKNEIQIMKQFGKTLGQHSYVEQQKQIELTIHYLKKALEEAIERRVKYEKMTKTIGFLVGIFIVLLLF